MIDPFSSVALTPCAPCVEYRCVMPSLRGGWVAALNVFSFLKR